MSFLLGLIGGVTIMYWYYYFEIAKISSLKAKFTKLENALRAQETHYMNKIHLMNVAFKNYGIKDDTIC
jgi:hypothetical protein